MKAAGYGYAKVPKSMSRSWGDLVRGYLESAEDLRVICEHTGQPFEAEASNAP